MLKYITLLILVSLISCNQSNKKLEKYIINSENNREPFFAIDSEKSKNIYITKIMEFNYDSIYVTKFSFYVSNDKFYAKSLKPETEYFVLFDFNAKLNETKKIIIKAKEKIKTFDCTLEKQIQTNKNLNIKVFRIQKWAKLSNFFGGLEMDVIVFLSDKHGVIGSYYESLDKYNKKIMIAPAGEILKNYIDYSKITEVELL